MGDCEDSSHLKVRWTKAEPRRVSPSDASEVMRMWVLSFKLSTTLRIFLITSACCRPDSCLQSPDTRMGRAAYSRLSLHKRPRAPIVALHKINLLVHGTKF